MSIIIEDIDTLLEHFSNIDGGSSITIGTVQFSSDFIEEINRNKKNSKRYEWLRDYHLGNDPESINLETCQECDTLDEAIDENLSY